MSDAKTELSGPDLTQGIELSRIADGTMLLGHARGEPVLFIRRGTDVFAIGAHGTRVDPGQAPRAIEEAGGGRTASLTGATRISRAATPVGRQVVVGVRRLRE